MIHVWTDSTHYEIDPDLMRLRCINFAPLPDLARPHCDPVSSLPRCYLAQPRDDDGWATFDHMMRPRVGAALRALWPDGTRLVSMRALSVEVDC